MKENRKQKVEAEKDETVEDMPLYKKPSNNPAIIEWRKAYRKEMNTRIKELEKQQKAEARTREFLERKAKSKQAKEWKSWEKKRKERGEKVTKDVERRVSVWDKLVKGQEKEAGREARLQKRKENKQAKRSKERERSIKG